MYLISGSIFRLKMRFKHPFVVKPALTIIYNVNLEDNSVSVYTQTMNCGLLQYSYNFRIVAWELHKANTESLNIRVTERKGTGSKII